MRNLRRSSDVQILFVAVIFCAILAIIPVFVSLAASPDDFLWPYNEPTNITFNEADVLQAWTDWKSAQITNVNAGGNGRLRVMGGVNGSSTVSEGQGYGILFASLFDEQDTVDGLWLFTADHLNSQGLMDWHIGNPGQRLGTGAATDGDEDIAMGLLNACIKVQQGVWPTSPQGIDYCHEATDMINAIYEYEVDKPGSSPPAGLNNNPGNELLPGDEWNLTQDYPEGIVNLSYFAPGYYTVFGKFTNNEAAWEAVNTRNYELVNLVQSKPDNCSGLVPNWNQYDGDAQLVSWQPTNYAWWSYDAARFAWRIAVHQRWYNTAASQETSNEVGSFFSSVGFNNIGEHSMNGQKTGSGPWPFFVANAGSAVWAADNLTAVNCGAANGTLQETPQSAYNRVLTTKDTPNSYYGNAWRLLAMLLMTGNFPNFYELADGNPPLPTNTPAPVTATAIPPSPTTPSGSSCTVNYTISNQWNNGFTTDITIVNNSNTPINGWTLTWTFANGQQVTSSWNATVTQVGNQVTASQVASHWNGHLSANGGSVNFGMQGTHTGSNPIPVDFVLNGTACNDNPPLPTTAPPTATTVPPTATTIPPTATAVPTSPPTATPSSANCTVNYNNNNDWGTGFTANVTITNNGSTTVNGWTLAFTFPGNQLIVNAWNGNATQTGTAVTVTDVGWNGTLPPSGSASFGFQASYSNNNTPPATFTLNGQSCH